MRKKRERESVRKSTATLKNGLDIDFVYNFIEFIIVKYK